MNTHYKVPGKALELCNAFGFLFPGELFLIQALVASLPEESVAVQLGAGVGTGSLGMVEMRPNLKMYTVDISEGGPFGGMENERNAFKDTGLPLPIQILGNSQIIWKDWKLNIDLLFIDADHELPGVHIDTQGWTPFVKVGGYAIFHDYSSNNWPKVAATVDELMTAPDWQHVLTVDTLIAFRRLPEISDRNKFILEHIGNAAFETIPVENSIGKTVRVSGPISEPKVKVITKRARK